jgi:hypothetical protein
MSIQDDEIQLKRLKLKLAINRYLRTWGKQYSNKLQHMLRCDEPAFYESVVAEMVVEGLLTKSVGYLGAVILVYRDISEVSHV